MAVTRDSSFLQLHRAFSGISDAMPPSAGSLRDHEKDFSQATKDLPQRIYILGVGNVGTFIAHSLAGIPNRPPLTLLLRRWERLRDYRAKGSALRLTTHNMTQIRRGFDIEAPEVPSSDTIGSDPMPLAGHSEQSGDGVPLSQASAEASRPLYREQSSEERDNFDAEIGRERNPTSEFSTEHDLPTQTSQNVGRDSQDLDTDNAKTSSEPLSGSSNTPDRGETLSHDNLKDQSGVIHHLIVTVKAHHTVSALRPFAHRLSSQSTILFLQNGMGMIDEVNKEIFTHENDRPHYMVGILSHGLYGRGPFDVVHAGDGTIALGLLVDGNDYPPSGRYLLRTMTRTPVFVAVGFTPTDLIQQQLDKLAINAVVNPLTAIMDCFNGQLLDNFFLTRVIRLLVAEISVVFRSLPELENVPNVNMRFDTARLESLIVRIAQLTGRNRSSMLQDVRNGRQTEIDYINGYIIRRGEELGIHCVTNYMLMQMVKAKDKLNEQERGRVIPLQPSIKPK